MIRLPINYGLEDLLLSNTLKSLEVNVIIKNNDENIGKYDDKVDEGIFLGYASNNKGYTCYNKRLHKLVDSIDIKINEGTPVKDIQISSVEPDTKYTVEVKEKEVQ